MAHAGRFAHSNHPQQTAKRPRGPTLFGAARDETDEVDDRSTPDSLWRPLNKEFRFTIDLAASADNAKCPRFYSLTDDSLTQDWSGEVGWCNPPYSDLRPWVKKAHETTSAVVVMLLPANRTEQRWWHEFIEPNRDRIGSRLVTRFVLGRQMFGTPDGSRRGVGSPPFGVVLCIWGALETGGEG